MKVKQLVEGNVIKFPDKKKTFVQDLDETRTQLNKIYLKAFSKFNTSNHDEDRVNARLRSHPTKHAAPFTINLYTFGREFSRMAFEKQSAKPFPTELVDALDSFVKEMKKIGYTKFSFDEGSNESIDALTGERIQKIFSDPKVKPMEVGFTFQRPR